MHEESTINRQHDQPTEETLVFSTGSRCSRGWRGAVLVAAATVWGGCLDPSTNCDEDTSCPPGASGPGTSTGSAMGGSEDPTTQGPTAATTAATTALDTTAGSTTEDNVECGDCPPSTPYCVVGGCRSCEELVGMCGDLDPDRPVCDPTSGQCVACTDEDLGSCGDTTPICAGNTCRGCVEHSECPSSACNLSEGGCMPDGPGDVLFVDETYPGCVNGDGTSDNAYCDIVTALEQVMPGEAATIIVRGLEYEDNVIVEEGRAIAILGDTMPRLEGAVGFEALSVTTDSSLFVSGLQLFNGNSEAMTCTDASLWIDQSSVRNNARGIDSTSCDLYVRRTDFCRNNEGGLQITGGNTSITNSIIADNGTDASAVSGIQFSSGTFEIIYSTLATNTSGDADSKGLRCAGGSAQGSVRNSILVALGNEDAVGCDPAEITVEYSVIDDPQFEMRGNNVLREFEPGDFLAAGNCDFHLADDQTFAGIPMALEGDPVVDIDGQSREGTDFAGADVVLPP